MMVGLGNKIEQKYPDSPLTKTVQSIDQAMYASNTHSIEPTFNKTSKSKILQDRKGGGRMSAGGAVVAIFFLALLACAGICLIIGAFAGAFATLSAAIGVGLMGAAILVMSILGMKNVSKKRRATRELEEQQKKETGL
jgi:putative methionine-R-sulfoxide reductase with GAF domain